MLTVGTRLGPYEITGALGAGGMGEVYRARDMKLQRDVAIKVLPELFARDPERLARFEREARTLAALNHPHIAQVFGVEESLSTSSGQAGTIHALVMEFVDGEDLSQRIARTGAIPLEEALPIARQIADALEAAHEQGIIHRDLKPANVKVRPDGTVKVLDFGLAKALTPADPGRPEGLPYKPDVGQAFSPAIANSPTITSPFQMSQLGVILGTAAYMAPEQAKGKAVDKRSDIWAFGCVLYELLTGRRAFEGEDLSDTLAAVLRQELDLRALPASTSQAVRRLIARCLERNSKQRLRDIGEARIEIARLESGADDAAPASAAVIAAPPRWRRVLPWLAAGVVTTAFLTTLVLWPPWRAIPRAPLMRLSVEAGISSSLEFGIGTVAILSPDGQTMVFVGFGGSGRQLFTRRLDQLQATRLAGTEGGFAPFFSPDSQWIGFFAAGKLKKISVTGGAAVTLCAAPNGRGGSWGEDDSIVFQPIGGAGPLMQIHAAGGTPAPLGTIPAGAGVARWPQVLPGARALLYSSNSSLAGFEGANLVIQPLPAGTPKVIVRGGFHGRYVRSGHIVYIHEGTLFAVPFDLSSLEVTGRPAPALEGILSSPTGGSGQFSISDAGTIVYLPGGVSGASRPISWMDHTGTTTPLRTTEADWSSPRFSPDGRKLALAIDDGTQSDIWVYEWARDIAIKFTIDPASDTQPVWTPDGRRLVFASDRGGKGVYNLYWRRADGVGGVQRLTESSYSQFAWSFDPSGKFLAFNEIGKNSGDLLILPLDGDEAKGWKPGTPTVFLSTQANEISPMFSPDGGWIAYMSDEVGQTQVFVRPFPGPGGQWQISSSSVGTHPSWALKQRELLFLDPATTKIMAVEYNADGESFHHGKPRLWSPGSWLPHGLNRIYDLHPDGRRVAIAKPADAAVEKRDKVVMIFNFFEELRRVAPPSRKP